MTESDQIEAELLTRELATRKLASYIDYCFVPNFRTKTYDQTWHTRLICDYLEKIESGEITRLIIEMPPRHAKSLHVSRFFPAWFMCKHPLAEIIHATHTDSFAEDFGRDVRDIILDPKNKNIFPKIKIRQDQSSKKDWKLEQGGSYTARGVGGALSGRGATVFLADDLVKDWADANSVLVQESIWNWFNSVANTRLAPDGRMIVMMTRWNTEDVIGRLIARDGLVEDGGVWHRLRLPALADGTVPLHPRDPRKDGGGEALWPEWFSRESLLAKSGEAQMFAAMYQQDPIRAMGQTFKKQDFRYFALSDIKPQEFELCISIDPAFSTRQSSDDTGIAVVARHKVTRELYVLELLGETILPSEAYAYTVSIAEKWKTAGWTLSFISIEDVAISQSQRLFYDGFDKYMRENHKFYTLLPFKVQGKGKKQDRIKFSLEPLFNRHALYFRSDDSANDVWRRLEQQLLKFPASRKDDLIDSLSHACIMLSEQGTTADASANTQVMRTRLLKLQAQHAR